jgi:excinuclease ABC subunit A
MAKQRPASRAVAAAPNAAISAPRSAIEVERARTHNLKEVTCRVPHGQVTVITGPSGAGKSSLAFDTIYAEGQRRFVESMSTYARQFLQQMERADVDDVRNVPPAVAIEAKNSVRNARATVGTLTESHDVLRLLFANLGRVECPSGHGPMRRWTAAAAAADLAAGPADPVGAAFTLVARVARPKKDADVALAELVRQGFARRLVEEASGERLERLEPGSSWKAGWNPLPLALGRFSVAAFSEAGESSSEARARLQATLEEGYRLTGAVGSGGGRVEALGDAGRRVYQPELSCAICGEVGRTPSPPLFSFNSPLGACVECQGFGRTVGVDADRVIPDPNKSLLERPIAPWNTPAYEELYEPLYKAARRHKIPLDRPWVELSPAEREFVWRGEAKGLVSLDDFFRWLEARTYKVHVRVLLARYRAYTPCAVCGGARLKKEALAVKVAGQNIAQLAARPIAELRAWFAARDWEAEGRGAGDVELARHLVAEVAQRLDVLERVGLGYLSLDRQARTLSGGESQRIHLASALGSGLTGTLYALDEPTIGLHPQDSDRLLGLLRHLAQRGNTVLVVEHDRTIVRGADHVIDLGPRAGEHGGRLIVEGTPEEVLRHPESLTAAFLRDRPPTEARRHLARFRREHSGDRGDRGGDRRHEGRDDPSPDLESRPRFGVRGASAHNLRSLDITFPIGALVAVSGVSGSGKSTLVENVLYGGAQRSRGVVDVEPGACDELIGMEQFEELVLVDQEPLGRSTRSNPVTYVKAYDELRKLYAAEPAAQARGITAAHFSFNLDRGRCPACEGTGIVEVDMQFMAPVTVTCDVCQGRRFQAQVLAVRVRGRTIAETLELTVEEGLREFADQRGLCRKLRALTDAGLGYLRLGQPTSTLSGGEAQRLKLASFLDRAPAESKRAKGKGTVKRIAPRPPAGRLFLFDEPTTGLHASDIDLLYRTLRRLVKAGHSVLVVEHSLELLARCDWIADLGPGGGQDGGRLLFNGRLDDFLEHGKGPTADELRDYVRFERVEGEPPLPVSGGGSR